MRSSAQYLPGFDNSGKWIKAKCPSHGGESSNSLHIDSETGGFVCHAGTKQIEQGVQAAKEQGLGDWAVKVAGRSFVK